MRRMRDMRSRSTRTGRFIRDKRHEPMRREREETRSRMRRDYGDYDRRYDRPEWDRYDGGYDYDRYPKDYGDDDCYLSDDELAEWAKELLRKVPDNDKSLFTKDMIERKAREMGITFDDFTLSELYTTALMLYTDFGKTFGGGNLDLVIRLAKDFLCDDDIELDGGEKLCAYYEHIVCAE